MHGSGSDRTGSVRACECDVCVLVPAHRLCTSLATFVPLCLKSGRVELARLCRIARARVSWKGF
eukprot:4771864-Prymnesium_polylepis.1